MILIVSTDDDAHSQRVIAHLTEMREPFTLLDLSALPDPATLSIAFPDHAGPRLELDLGNGAPLDLSTVKSVWWRRPQAVDLSACSDPEVHMFVFGEWREALGGLWGMVDAHWVNDPVRDEVASHKPLQLKIAQQVGLTIPRTLMTTDREAALKFIRAQGPGGCIYKTFSCTHAHWRETRVVGEAEVAHLDSLKLAPVIFQQNIASSIDLRATVIGEELFCLAIDARQSEYPQDFRPSLGSSSTQAYELPAEVADKLIALQKCLGLAYGAIDLRLTPEGEFVFLEVNPAGEFIFVEDYSGYPVAEAMARYLAAARPV